MLKQAEVGSTPDPNAQPLTDPERPEHAPQHDGGRDMKRREEEQERQEQAGRRPERQG